MIIEENLYKPKKKKRNYFKLDFNERAWIFMLIPAVIFTILFRYASMFGIVMAFQDFDPLSGFLNSDFVGLKHFEFVFKMDDFSRAFFNTLIIAFWKIILSLLVPLIVALLLNEVGKELFSKFVKTSIFLPFFLSWVILGGIMSQILGLYGPVNAIIQNMGFEPLGFLIDNSLFRGVLIVSDVWKGMGYNMVIFLAAITGIDQGLYESAKMDGATRIQQTWHVTIPGMAPVIILLATLSIGGLLSAGFEQVFVLYNPVVYDSGDIIDTLVYRLGIKDMQFSRSAAVDLFRSLINLILIGSSYFLAYKYTDYRIF